MLSTAHPSTYLTTCSSIHLPSTHQPSYWFIHQPSSQPPPTINPLFIPLPIHPSIHAFIHLSTHLPYHLSIHNTHLPVHLSTIYPSTITFIHPSILSPTSHHQSIGHHITIHACMHPSIYTHTRSFMQSPRAYSTSGLCWVLKTRQFLPSRCVQSLSG